MRRSYGMWRCYSNPTHTSKDAHIMALHDYSLLLNPSITNREFREFTRLSSASTANKLLTNLDLPRVGHTKGTSYCLVNEKNEPFL